MNLELPRPTKGQLFLLWSAGLAAITLTASGEYALYVACGFGTGWSAAGPVCIDAYVMAAIHARREVPFAVLVMVGTNATAHLLPEAGPPVPVVVAVSALAPVVLWRVHALAAGSVRQADGTVTIADGTFAQQATVNEPVFTLTRENPGGPLPGEATNLTTNEGAWSAPWEAEPWPPLNRGDTPTVAALAPVSPTDTTAVVAQQATTGPGAWVTQTATQVVTDEGVSTATDAPAGDHGGYQGGDQPDDRGPGAEVVTGVVTTEAFEGDTVSLSNDQPGDQPDAAVPMTEAEVRRAARALNRRTVKDTGRPVTVAVLQAEFGLSRRAATDLRRAITSA